MSDGFAIVEPDEVSATTFNTCDTAVRKLTEPLGCAEMRVNQVLVEPGEVTTPHTHEGQEEVFVAMTDGEIAVDDEVYTVPRGGVVRVGPNAVRSLCNQTGEATHVWLAFGAPPVGTVDDFGEYVVADEER